MVAAAPYSYSRRMDQHDTGTDLLGYLAGPTFDCRIRVAGLSGPGAHKLPGSRRRAPISMSTSQRRPSLAAMI